MATAASASNLYEQLPYSQIEKETTCAITKIKSVTPSQPHLVKAKNRVEAQVLAAKFPWPQVAWLGCLKIIPRLKKVDHLLGEVANYYATDFDCTTTGELQKAARKIDVLRDLIKKLLTVSAQCGLLNMWVYGPIYRRIQDHDIYLASIMEGFALSADSDFSALIRDTIGAETPEIPNCLSAK